MLTTKFSDFINKLINKNFNYLRNHHKLKNIIQLVFWVATIGLYLFCTIYRAKYRNTDYLTVDQGAYIFKARSLRKNGYKNLFKTKRNRMPLFPFIISFGYQSGFESFFNRAKLINIGISLVYLVFLWLFIKKKLPNLLAKNLIVAIAFSVFVFRSPYVETETTLYFFLFFSMFGFVKMLKAPSFKTAILTALFAALSFYSKYSALIFIGIFIFSFLLKHMYQAWKKSVLKSLTPIKYLLTFLISFLVFISPHVYNNKKMFNTYFYNVNTTFYVWYDSFEEAKRGTRALGDRLAYPKFPPNQTPPSLKKYLNTHTPAQVIKRQKDGMGLYLNYLLGKPVLDVHLYGYHQYFLLFTANLLILLILEYRQIFKIFKKNSFIAAFLSASFFAYFLSISWYSCIAFGNRFLLVLYLPFLFYVTLFIKQIDKQKYLNYFTVQLLILNLYQLYMLIDKVPVIDGAT